MYVGARIYSSKCIEELGYTALYVVRCSDIPVLYRSVCIQIEVLGYTALYVLTEVLGYTYSSVCIEVLGYTALYVLRCSDIQLCMY